MKQHLVRIGAMGQVGRFDSVESVRFRRGDRVVTRTGRGLEIGEVLAPPAEEPCDAPSDGTILRGMTVQDELLDTRLQKNRTLALRGCSELLEKRNVDATLLDAECLFDGQNVVFYFLGPVTEEVDRLTAELAETYDMSVQMRQFAETLTEGCGPDCGTGAVCGTGAACGTGGACSTCSVACGSRG